MKKINGSWLEFNHSGIAEGKYMNPRVHNFTDEQWSLKVQEMADFGMKYIIVMGIAYCDVDVPVETFYDSKIFPKSKMLKAKDPLEAVLKTADENDMLVFVSVGHFGPWRLPWENMTKEETFQKAFKAMDEVYKIYGHHKSFYGWYYPDELGIEKYIDEEFITYANRYSEKSHQINPNLKTLVAPYGTNHLVADDYYVSQLKRLDVDFVAYQDEVGVKKSNEFETKKYYENLKKAHDKANRSKLWADMETFTFEGDVYKSALLPANIERLEQQMKSISPYVEEIVVFEYQGMFDAPGSKIKTGPRGSVKYYKDYKKLLKKIEK